MDSCQDWPWHSENKKSFLSFTIENLKKLIKMLFGKQIFVSSDAKFCYIMHNAGHDTCNVGRNSHNVCVTWFCQLSMCLWSQGGGDSGAPLGDLYMKKQFNI